MHHIITVRYIPTATSVEQQQQQQLLMYKSQRTGARGWAKIDPQLGVIFHIFHCFFPNSVFPPSLSCCLPTVIFCLFHNFSGVSCFLLIFHGETVKQVIKPKLIKATRYFLFFVRLSLLVEIYYKRWLVTIGQNLRAEHRKREFFPKEMLNSFYFLVEQFLHLNSVTFIHVPYFNNLCQLLQLHIQTTKVVTLMKHTSVDFANCCWRFLKVLESLLCCCLLEVFGPPGGNNVGYNSLWQKNWQSMCSTVTAATKVMQRSRLCPCLLLGWFI